MANHKGSEGLVKIGANTVAEVKSWNLNESASTIDTTEIGDSARTKTIGTTEWSGSVDCFWDETDTNGQIAMAVGGSVTLNLYPEGATSADIFYTGTALMTGVSRSAAVDGMVEASFSFEGDGALTEGAVP